MCARLQSPADFSDKMTNSADLGFIAPSMETILRMIAYGFEHPYCPTFD
jgi:hypothetical protein